MTAIFLENLTWLEAEEVLREDSMIVIPLGAALKEHGKHLPLNNDKLLVDGLVDNLGKRLNIVVMPTIGTSFYPAFVEYPGSISLSLETSAALIGETCTGLARFGCKKIYVLNTGVSTTRVLSKVSEFLKENHPTLRFSYTDFKRALDVAAQGISQQSGGGHADEIETSIMLFLAPNVVHMEKAEKDFHGNAPGPLHRDEQKARDANAVYSPTGAWGDPTLATKDKGETIVNRLLDWIENDIRKL